MAQKDESITSNHKTNNPTIGIITARPTEYTAVKRLLEDVSQFQETGQGAGRIYDLGRIPAIDGQHQIVLALADTSTNSAAIRAMLLLEHFPTIQYIIMVGVAGGIPNFQKPSQHVNLGDVVISDKEGIVQYDVTEETIDNIKPRHLPRPPSSQLLEYVRYLQVAEQEDHRPWLKFIDDSIRDKKHILEQPKIIKGTIASANKDLQNPTIRDKLRDQFDKVRAIEMTSSGIADATWNHGVGYLVIRGICHYCDGEEINQDWETYAAITAAAYTRALLESIPTQPINQTIKDDGTTSGQPINQINRILIATGLANLLVIGLFFLLSIPVPLLIISGILGGMATFLLLRIGNIGSILIFQNMETTTILSIGVILSSAFTTYILTQPIPVELRIARLDGLNNAGWCGTSCTVIIEGAGVATLESGQRLAVYSPEARLTNDVWSEAPIAIIRILGIEQPIAFAQTLLIHENAEFDSSKQLTVGQHLARETQFSRDSLIPAFGDGYVDQTDTVYLRRGVAVQINDCFVTLEPQTRGHRIVDHLEGDTELQIIALGQVAASAQTQLIIGHPPTQGDIVQLKQDGCSKLFSYEPDMVFISKGVIEIGSIDGETNEQPISTVDLAGFYIAVTEVTNAQYRPFVEENIIEPKYWHDPIYNTDQQPVVGVSWYEAMAYANWLAQKTGRKYRLPSEAEWERAACGNPKRQYPWGNNWDGHLANFADLTLTQAKGKINWRQIVTWANTSIRDGYAHTAPVGSYPKGATPEGIFDLSGNVWEWTSTLYSDYPYRLDDGRDSHDLKGERIIRGGGWASPMEDLRCTYRSYAQQNKQIYHLGFRLARTP